MKGQTTENWTWMEVTVDKSHSNRNADHMRLLKDWRDRGYIYIYLYMCVCVCVCVTFFSFAFSFLFLECKNGLDSRSINQTKLISLGIYIRYTATYPVIFVLQLNSRQKVTWISCSPLHFSRIGTGNVGEERKCGRGRERLCLRMNGQAVSFEFAKDVGEEGRFRIESKHVTGESIDNGEAAAPEAVSIRFD